MIIRRLTPADWEAYRTLRLEALHLEPTAFGSDPSDQVNQPQAYWTSRLEGGPDSFVLGAFLHDHLVGMAGLRREQGAKTRHKAMVWGMYVSPGARGRGMGRRLLEQLIAEARELDGLRQLFLAVTSTNEPARSLYLDLGFRVYGTEPRALRVGERFVDEDLMYLAL
ncbi:MAG: GNAT family N-acetyltransferase [Bacillota bacterium]